MMKLFDKTDILYKERSVEVCNLTLEKFNFAQHKISPSKIHIVFIASIGEKSVQECEIIFIETVIMHNSERPQPCLRMSCESAVKIELKTSGSVMEFRLLGL